MLRVARCVTVREAVNLFDDRVEYRVCHVVYFVLCAFNVDEIFYLQRRWRRRTRHLGIDEVQARISLHDERGISREDSSM